MELDQLILVCFVCFGTFGILGAMFFVSYLVYSKLTRKQLDSLMDILEGAEFVALLGIKGRFWRRKWLYYPVWVPADVYIFENSLVFVRYSEVKWFQWWRALPVYLHSGEAELARLFTFSQVRLMYKCWVEEDELVIEYKYPALVEVRAQLRLRGVVGSEQFEDIRRLLGF